MHVDEAKCSSFIYDPKTFKGMIEMSDDEGGYETRSSDFKAGVAELIIEEGRKLMSKMK